MVHVHPLVLLAIVTSLMKQVIRSVFTRHVMMLKDSKLMVNVLLIERLVMELRNNLSTISLMLLIIENASRRLQICVKLLMLPKSMSMRMEHVPQFALTTKNQKVQKRNANPMDAKMLLPLHGLTLMEHAPMMLVTAKNTQ